GGACHASTPSSAAAAGDASWWEAVVRHVGSHGAVDKRQGRGAEKEDAAAVGVQPDGPIAGDGRVGEHAGATGDEDAAAAAPLTRLFAGVVRGVAEDLAGLDGHPAAGVDAAADHAGRDRCIAVHLARVKSELTHVADGTPARIAVG